MEKEQPPPYSTTMDAHPLPGFTAPSSQSQSQAYPPPEGQAYPPPGGQPYHLPGPPPYPPQGQSYPQPGYVQHGQATYTVGPVATVVIQTASPMYGPTPQPTGCPHCHQQIQTKVQSEPDMRTHLFALVCCLFGCVPCCVLPYFMDSCQSQNHYCPRCGAFLGTYNGDLMMNRRRVW